MTFDEIGATLKLTRERVRQIEIKVNNKLRTEYYYKQFEWLLGLSDIRPIGLNHASLGNMEYGTPSPK